MRILSNIPALLGLNAANLLKSSAEKSIRRIADGLRIGISADDAAGLAISEKLRSQIRGLDQAVRNAQDGVSMLQTAEGALNETHSILQRMRELSVQAANDTLTLQDRTYIQQEVDQLKEEIDRIASTTQFNKKKLLSGDASVLWSTDSLDIGVFVDGSLRSKDIFGQDVAPEGNFRLRITPTAGEAEVLKTNVFYLKHGTVTDALRFSPESGAVSGLQGLRSLHLVEGEYRLETREVPYGGITYHLANGTETANPAATLGVVAMEASALPDILPYGEYRVRVADEAPFMAHYGSESGGVFGTQVIDRVDPMGRNDVDLSMDASNVAGAVNSQTRLAWTDIGGAGAGTVNVSQGGGITGPAPAGTPYPHDPTAGDALFNVRDDYDINMWTHFRVNSTDSRDTLNTGIAFSTYYRSEGSAVADTQATLGLTYRTANPESVTLRTSFRTAADTRLRFERSGVGSPVTVDVSNRDLRDIGDPSGVAYRIQVDLDAAWGAGAVTVSVVTSGEQRLLSIRNNMAGQTLTISNETASAADLELNVVALASGATRSASTFRDYRRAHAVDIAGRDIEQAASALDSALAAYNIDFVDSDLGGDIRRLQIDNNSSAFGVAGSHFLEMETDVPGSFEEDMGISGLSLAAGASHTSRRVLHGYSTTVNTGNMRIDQIQAALQGALNFTPADYVPPGAVFSLQSPAADTRRIDINTTRYDLSITGTGSTVQDVFGANQSLTRGGSHTGATRDFGVARGSLTAGQNIEQLFDAVNSNVLLAGILSASWTTQPNYTGAHNGRFRLDNIDGTAERREVVFSGSGGGATPLLSNTSPLRALVNRQTNSWQARDSVSVTTTWQGITATGVAVNGVNTSEWWEGEVGSSNPLVGIGALPFTSVYIPDSSGSADLAAGDSWALFTSAASAGNHDRLDFRIRDGATSATYDSTALGAPNHGASTYGGGSMVFNNGVLDVTYAGVMLALPHLFRTGVGGFSTDSSQVSFVQNGFDNIAGATFADILRTAERYDATAAGWDTAGTADDRWYARTWYGEDTSYYLAGKDPASVLPPGAIEVWRQEDVNASLLFTSTGSGTFLVQGKGYTRAGARVDFEETIDLNLHGPVSAANQLVLNAGAGAGEIRFDAFAPVGVSGQDRFVVNIAARAGGSYENATPGVGAAFLSDSVVTVDADPWGLTGSSHRTMEYRFDSGVEDLFHDADPTSDPESRLRMFGFFVDPNNSNSATNVSTGELMLNVAATGFAAGTRAGEDGGGSMPYIVAEVNYQGKTTPEAGAIVNSFYFQDMKEGEGERDFLSRVEYAADETRNAVLLFDVLDERDGGVTLRVQGHVVDRNGDYRYIEAETTGLNNSNENFSFLSAPGFEGLRFTHFDFSDVTRLRKGDRFTLSLVADGRTELDPVSGRYAVDELNLFGGDTDPGLYPISWRFFDGVLDESTTLLRTYQVAPSETFGNGSFAGKVYDGSLSLSFGSFHGGTAVGDPASDETPRVVKDAALFGSVYREGIDGGVAHRYSTLRDVAQFWDANGRFLLDTPSTIQIRQGDKVVGFTLSGDEEIQSLLERLNKTVYQHLGEGVLQNLVASPWNRKFATFTGSLTDKNPMESVQGTMVLRSALAGSAGSYEFLGDEDVLKALGFVVINAAKENSYSVDISDAHTGLNVARGLKVDGGGELYGVWGDAIRLRFDALLGVSGTRYSEESGRFITGTASEVYRTVHLADNSTILQIGANEGEKMLLSMGAVDVETLGVADVRVTARESATRSITLVDRAIDRVSRQRAQIGSLTNRLGHATSALVVASENLSAADSRLRDLDYAKEMMNFVRIQILTQANMSMMSQANQLPRNVLSLLGQ